MESIKVNIDGKEEDLIVSFPDEEIESNDDLFDKRPQVNLLEDTIIVSGGENNE